MTSPPPHPSTRIQKLLAAGLGIVFALIAGEILLRLVGAAPEVAPVRRGRFQLSASLARELGFHHLDLRPAFNGCRAERGQRLRFDRYHPTAAGHRCAAEALASAVREIMAR